MSELHVTNPATGEIIASLPIDKEETVSVKYSRARAAQPAWAATPLSQRLALMQKFRERLMAEHESLARLLSQEVGKPIRQARNELHGFLARFDYFQNQVAEVLAEEEVYREDGLRETLTQEPLGVIANISAWNYPWLVGCNVFIPALLTGNTVLYKPSEFSSLTGLAIARLFQEAGFPEDVFIPVIGGRETGAALLQEDLNGVFFTGSHATGAAIAERMAGRMVRLGMELGGKDPLYVCDDVDIAAVAAAAADGAFYNNGQSCCAVERIYVHHHIYPAFLEAFTAVVKAFVVGDPLSEETYIGALTRGPSALMTLEAQVEDALHKGARLLCGGQALEREGAFFAPTVLADTNHSMEIMLEESFGPIIGIQPVYQDEEAVTLMNDTLYGLTASVYTPDQERARKILSRMHTGTVYWNCCDRVSPHLPWTGRGHSGLGSTLSRAGILSFTQPKAWHWRG
ncbi:aldehyde dehydrogenase [bacterium (Candidatus Blackallbacteria) CG17_big_fil_post_rev_8_21_14_2_50_48_46]|uniref:Aldehyde dehydrogenase n=1 Tax=bacterium (Candidatus Blackallbacteria) CG17_big_fil_post_rev_8_21_14_2_50_48_46 TaxID=2014261 RepID=A0A2M7FZP4_9BACT|nr:MAG: aldehyde dehydrogenase [bacterium (Candidatus Blackallbacteria) CG18_big_fil_WC_8_21_14_2_50_49_26]PIW14626.1 MAG: aldehyde dehydrogenase [bacterium (Candidatus Blackallbacteria) CG17_big_fil_post_rev_8_21_14_2_50_48_46]PIW45677.1 MAG: aldehyde dehydrogenase [bacterium (Candidatus Blackallbacteria) CG13_big_fil_rev_8_21_14_2_50_49_14]